MFCSYYFHPVFTTFTLCFVVVIDSTITPEKEMDDITSFKPNTYCKFQANRFKCGKHERGKFRYYYDAERNTCEPFMHGGCTHLYNVFSSLRSCKAECKGMNVIPTFTNITKNIFCRLQPEFGNCNSYYPRWYFDISEMTCRGFSYSGCGGNHNNFDLAHKCTDVCVPAIRHCKPPSLEKPTEILTCYT